MIQCTTSSSRINSCHSSSLSPILSWGADPGRFFRATPERDGPAVDGRDSLRDACTPERDGPAVDGRDPKRDAYASDEDGRDGPAVEGRESPKRDAYELDEAGRDLAPLGEP